MNGIRIAVAALVTLLPAGACSSQEGSAGHGQPAGGRATSFSSRAPPDARSTIDSLIELGQEVYWRGAYDSARALWRDPLEYARARADTTAEADLLTWLGLAAWRLGDYADARRLGERALALKLEANLREQLFRSYNALGLLAWNEGRLSDAVELFEKGRETADAVKDGKGVAAASGNLALVETELGEFSAARHGFEGARQAGRALGDERIEANALTNLAMLDIRVGDPASAIASLEESRRLYERIDYSTGEINALGQLGTAYAALGEPQRALAALDSALALARRLGLRQEEASDLEALAELHRGLGDLPRALRLYAEAKAINRELGLDVEVGIDLRNEGEIHAALDTRAEALNRIREALEIHRRTGARFEELVDLLYLAELEQQAGLYRESGASLDSARRLAGSLATRHARLLFAITAARIADRAAQPRHVLRVLGQARDDLASGGYGTEWEAEALRARAYAVLGALDSAAAAGRRAVDAVERVRGDLGSGVLRTSFLSDKATVYANLVDVLLRLQRVEEAFEVSDASRGRALLEGLTAARRDVAAPDVSAGALLRADELLRRIDEQLVLLAGVQDISADAAGSDRGQAEQLMRQIEEARREYEELLMRSARGDPAATALLGSRRVSASEVKEALRPDELLLEFLVTPERLVLFLVSREGVESLSHSVRARTLESQVRLARDLLSSPGSDLAAGHGVLAALHERLLRPALDANALENPRRLIIVPHGMLSYLPFAALRDPHSGRYVGEDFALLYLPSAGVLPALRAGRRAEPAGGGESFSVMAFAPFPDLLPSTRVEIDALRGAKLASQRRVGRRATEAQLRVALSRSELIHLATHGRLNPRNPMFSRIELARGSSGPNDDGRLEVHEILGLRLASPLVFLSGCETGLGSAWSTGFTRGDDFATLAQSFLYAGAHNVVATLWRIEDEGAAAFAERFYRHLRTQAPPEALAAAQRELIRAGPYRHPYYWAAYSLSGSGELASRGQKPGVMSVKQ